MIDCKYLHMDTYDHQPTENEMEAYGAPHAVEGHTVYWCVMYHLLDCEYVMCPIVLEGLKNKWSRPIEERFLFS